MPNALFMGMYTTSTPVADELAMASAVNTLRELPETAGAPWWTMAAPMTTDGSPAITLLTRADAIAMAASTPNSLLTVFRGAMAEAAMTMDADVRTAAAERFAKSLTAAAAIVMRASIHSAIDAARTGCNQEAAQHWDRAAVLFTALETKVRSRSMGMITGVWGAGHDRLSEDDMVAVTVDKLTRGQAAINAGAASAVRSIGDELAGYSSRYFFLSVVNYGNEIPEVIAMMDNPLAPQNEGMTFAEGLIFMVNYGRPETPAAMALRARWRGPAAMINKNAVIRLSAGLYLEAVNADLMAFAAASPEQQLSIASRTLGVVDALAEPLRLSGSNVMTLKANMTAARTSVAGAMPMAAVPAITAVRDALATLAMLQ
jgi:hypothetical protein